MTERAIRVIRAPDRVVPEHQTPGMRREQALVTDEAWVGTFSTEPGMQTGWHHHGEYESYIYVLAGGVRMEFGPGGGESVEAGPGDFVVIPRQLVHREGSAAGSRGVQGVLFRIGHGPVSVNVEGPE